MKRLLASLFAVAVLGFAADAFSQPAAQDQPAQPAEQTPAQPAPAAAQDAAQPAQPAAEPAPEGDQPAARGERGRRGGRGERGRRGRRGEGRGRRGGGARGRGPGDEMNDLYSFGPDSAPRAGVPQGELQGPFVIPSEVYPGTQHTYWVYVPVQYDPAVPASLMVYNDGAGYLDPEGKLRVRFVMDNLIYRREIPVMIGVFINPGRTPDQPEATSEDWGDQTTNRPEEYNSIDDRYARVIVDELLPDLKSRYNIADDPARRGIAGSSSGGIAAFGVAWHRPDQFGKVLSLIGTFVNLGGRGGNTFSDLVRESDPKPIRVFLFDGRNDNRFGGEERDWFLNNVKLKDALEVKGYDVNYVWGINPHSSWAGGTMYPSFLRWLWRDHPVSTDPQDMVERNYNGPPLPTNNAEPVAGAEAGG